jgi:hypothetical protein
MSTGYYRQNLNERRTVLKSNREHSLSKAKAHNKMLEARTRDENIEESKKWDYYREARALIVKGYTELNRRRK